MQYLEERHIGQHQVRPDREMGYRACLNAGGAVVACNAELDKSRATKVAGMAHNGLAQVISSCHTMLDGDTVFVLATGEMEADVNLVGVLAQAIVLAVYAAPNHPGPPLLERLNS